MQRKNPYAPLSITATLLAGPSAEQIASIVAQIQALKATLAAYKESDQ
jgi:hypothetical protein